ncbi:MAG: CPBP family intramembrane metalloprotease [Leadbetterella sp.]|nr:CPBP family intramembrane metalloprotease [Leadbetterella sp.]
MQKEEAGPKMPLSKTLGVLIGFPAMATLISLLLLNRSIITGWGFDFSDTFRLIVTGWYVIQIYLIYKILRSDGWSWSDIGYSLNAKKTLWFCLGYLVFAFGLLFFIEYQLAHAVIDPEKLQSVVKLSPKDTTARVIFIFMGLVAGLAEELVYRGFAIRALISNGLNRWLAVLLAAIPFFFQHGIKAYQLNWGTWYLVWGLVFGALFLWRKKLNLNIIIHWLIILSAMPAVLQAIR